jgi:hypothetical protein
MSWWEAHDGLVRDAGWRIRGLAVLAIGFLGAANALFEIAGQAALKLSTGAWHFRSFADLMRHDGAGIARPDASPWIAEIPAAPVFLVIGCLLVWQGLSILSGRVRVDVDESGEQGRP